MLDVEIERNVIHALTIHVSHVNSCSAPSPDMIKYITLPSKSKDLHATIFR
jgi:hypothetical protein